MSSVSVWYPHFRVTVAHYSHGIKVLLSLTRSNAEGKIGFVKEMNRICVALSRARHGMYVTGNMSMIEGPRFTAFRDLSLSF